jgi:hypothetical protein
MDKKGKIIRLACIAAAVSAAVTAGAVSLYMLWEKPPEQKSAPEVLAELIEPSPGGIAQPSASPENRGSAFVTESIPEDGRVSVKDQEVVVRQYGEPEPIWCYEI